MKFSLQLIVLFLFISVGAYAQQTIKVSGNVISAEDKEPIIGASVKVKDNPSIGTSTNLNGDFTLTVPAGSKTLVISYLGMKDTEVDVKEHVNVVMQTGDKILDEVVITTGMVQVDKRLFTGATTKIDASKALLGGVADVSRSLEGRSAGVSVQNVSGTFGTAPKIRVRGATSIYGSSRPLWVVDGVILEDAVEISADQLSSGDAVTLISSAIAGLNADDIESFQILKDGSATSIYGARAMAGVVVVTTKKGSAGHSSINYTGEFSYRLKPAYRDFNISNSQEQMGIYKEMEQKGWLEFASIANSSSSGVYGKMYHLINQYDRTTGKFGLLFTKSAMNNYLREAEYRNTDWFELLFNSAVTQNHAISISGGTDKAKFYTSLSVMEDPGWTIASGVERYTFNANAIFDLSKNLSLTILTSDSYRKQKAPGTLSQDIDVVSGKVGRNFDINPYSYALNTSRTMDPHETSTRNYAAFNIFDELRNNYIELGVVDLKFQGEMKWKPLKGLDFGALFSYRSITSEQEHFVKNNSNQANAYRAGIIPEDATIRESNPFLFRDPDDPNALPETVLKEGGIYISDIYKTSQIDFRASVQYINAINDIHIFNLFGGMESNITDRNHVAWTGWAFDYDNGGIASYDYPLFKQQVHENTPYYSNSWTYGRNLAYFAQASYSYKGRYTASATGRYEGSNKLGRSRKSRWLPTWNLGLAWNAHEEEWFKNKVLSHSTLRGSYSLTADRGPSFVTNALPVYRPERPWRPPGELKETAIKLEDGENSELTYEKKKEFNVGVDLGFLNNRINLVVDYYVRDNYDLIGTTYTQGLDGFALKYANVANMKSQGVEATISTTNIKTHDFSWTTDLTFSKAENEITRLDARSNVIQLVSGSGYAKAGYPVRALFSVPFVGLNEEGLPQIINEKNAVTSTDINFQEYEKLDFLKYEGPTDPTITGGLGNIFTYKGFRLNTFITYSFGNVIRLDPVFSSVYSDVSSMPKEFKNRWVKPGDEKYTDIPVIASRRQVYNNSTLGYAYNAYNYSTARIADGGFIRLKEVSLGYDIPGKIVNKLRLSTASIKIQATNLLLLYADKKLNGQDPEFFNSGGVATPMPKQFTLTVRLGI
ncbi:MAG: SusC/RagA family TonB-linked outer membrane protein [Dysgonamonadaceae bacterium]|jgi:TonB-linked SusC/RagA family outer membrane protein|nr:SusC/RagA family TonB-linked outer membrane protein [Dysgonamonadaceae bacterium]